MTNPDKKSSDYIRIKRKNLEKRVEILKPVIEPSSSLQHFLNSLHS